MGLNCQASAVTAAATPRAGRRANAQRPRSPGQRGQAAEPEERSGLVVEWPPLPAVGLWAAPGTCQVNSDLTEPVRRPRLAGYRVGGRSGRVPYSLDSPAL